MSQVYAKDKEDTEMQFEINARELQMEISNFVMRKNILPKAWRYAIGYPLIAKVDELVDNIVLAKSIYPTNEWEYTQRKHYQVLAIANCHQIQNKLVRAEKCVQTITAEHLDKFILKIGKEIGLLIAWKKSNKPIEKEKNIIVSLLEKIVEVLLKIYSK